MLVKRDIEREAKRERESFKNGQNTICHSDYQANPHVQQHIVWATTFRSGFPPAFVKSKSKSKAGATQTETSLLKQYVAGERVDLLDDYDFPTRSITETGCHSGVFFFFFKGRSDAHSTSIKPVHYAFLTDRPEMLHTNKSCFKDTNEGGKQLLVTGKLKTLPFSRLARPLQHQRILFNWGDVKSQLAKEGGSFEECDAAKPRYLVTGKLKSFLSFPELFSARSSLKHTG